MKNHLPAINKSKLNPEPFTNFLCLACRINLFVKDKKREFLFLNIFSFEIKNIYWVTSTSKNKTIKIKNAGNTAANGTHNGNWLDELDEFLAKLFPNGETSQLVLYLVGTKPSGISSFLSY